MGESPAPSARLAAPGVAGRGHCLGHSPAARSARQYRIT